MLQCQRLSFQANGHDFLFRDLDLSLRGGKLGVVGPNGSGKSSFLSLLAGEKPPTAGRVTRPASWLFLPQIQRVDAWPPLLGASLWARICDWWQVERGEGDEETLARLEGDWAWIAGWTDLRRRWQVPEAPWALDPAHLSGGELQRIRLALADLVPKDLWILDEPTLHLDERGRGQAQTSLGSFPGLLVVASHDRDLLEMTDPILFLEAGGHRIYPGGYSRMWEERSGETERLERAIERAAEERAAEKREAQRVREMQEKRAMRGKKDRESGSLPRILLGARKQNAEKTTGKLQANSTRRLALLSEAHRELQQQQVLRPQLRFDLSGEASRRGQPILSVDQLRLTVGTRPLWSRPLSFELARQEVLWVRGPNGSGKSSLLRALLSEMPVPSGEIRLHARHPVYLDQKLLHLPAGETLMGAWSDPSFNPDESFRRTVAARLGIGAEKLGRPFGTLSGGERMRVALTLLSTRRQPPDLILLDEPNNHLDLQTQEAVLEALTQIQAAMLLVSHEQHFVERLAPDRVLDLEVYA